MKNKKIIHNKCILKVPVSSIHKRDVIASNYVLYLLIEPSIDILI